MQLAGFIMYNKIYQVNKGMTFKEILSHVAKHSRYYANRCTHVQDGSKIARLVGPCGRIKIRQAHDQSFPLHYDWTIKVNHELIVNNTVFELNIPLDGYNCTSNYFLLSEHEDKSYKHITKLCGRSQDKMFYSTNNSVTVVVKVTFLKRYALDVLLFQYQTVSQKSLSFIGFQHEQKFQKEMDVLLFYRDCEFSSTAFCYPH